MHNENTTMQLGGEAAAENKQHTFSIKRITEFLKRHPQLKNVATALSVVSAFGSSSAFADGGKDDALSKSLYADVVTATEQRVDGYEFRNGDAQAPENLPVGDEESDRASVGGMKIDGRTVVDPGHAGNVDSSYHQ